MTRNQTDCPRVCTIALSRSLAARLMVYGTALMLLAAVLVHAWIGKGTYTLPSMSGALLMILLGCVSFVATLLIHEGIHGLFFRIFGGRPRYGVGKITWFLPYAYATSPGDRFTLLQMSAISLAPFFWISVVSLLAISIWPAVSIYAGIAFVANFSGAVGDLWLVRQIWRFHGCRDVVFTDESDALAVYSAAPAARECAIKFAAGQHGTRWSRFILRWLAAVAVILLSLFPLTLILALAGVRDLAVGPPQFVLYTFKNLPDTGIFVSFDFPNIACAGLLFATLGFFFDRATPSAPDKDTPNDSPHPVVV